MSQTHMEQLNGLLLEEHSRRQKDLVAKFITEKPELLSCLLAIIEEEDHVIAPRAAWALSSICDNTPLLLTHQLNELERIFVNAKNNSVLRNVSRTLALLPLSKEPSGLVLDRAFQLLHNSGTEVAIRAHCMTIVYKMSKRFPDIKSELRLILEELKKTGSPGEKSKSSKLLAKLN